jgi:hypothetical protein
MPWTLPAIHTINRLRIRPESNDNLPIQILKFSIWDVIVIIVALVSVKFGKADVFIKCLLTTFIVSLISIIIYYRIDMYLAYPDDLAVQIVTYLNLTECSRVLISLLTAIWLFRVKPEVEITEVEISTL